MPPSPARRTAALALVGLLAAVSPLVLVPAPAHASSTCTTERANAGGGTCDDELPPNTGPASVTLTGATATLTASASHADGDTDPVGLECRADQGEWGSCTLVGLSPGSHTVEVRAVDLSDAALLVPCDGLLCIGAEEPDYDRTPSLITFDGAPETQISGGPSDRLTPGTPVALTRTPQVVLESSDPRASFNCAANAHKVPCHAGLNTLKKLKPGPQVFVAQAVTADGRFDATPATVTFYIPVNLKSGQGKGWRRVRDAGSFSGDYLTTSGKGAVLTIRAGKVREVRLIAPVGPKLGTVAVRIGKGAWKKVRLTSAKASHLQEFVIRAAGGRAVGGAIQVKAVAVPKGGAVAVDAIVAR